MNFAEIAHKKTGIRVFGLVIDETKSLITLHTKAGEQKTYFYTDYTKIESKNHSKAFLAYQVKMAEQFKA